MISKRNGPDTTIVADRAPLSHETNTLDRRAFLQLATLSSAAFALAPVPSPGNVPDVSARVDPTVAGGAPARFAVFRSLQPGVVRPEGWLRIYLEKQSAELGRNLPKVSWPFSADYWSGEDRPPEPREHVEVAVVWPWEQKGYWIDGALRCALVLHDQELLTLASAPVDYSLGHILPDGFIGPQLLRDGQGANKLDGFRWGHAVFFRALAAHAEATDDERVAQAIRRHFLADRERGRYGGPSRDVVNIEGMLWAYERTGDAELLTMAQRAWHDSLSSAPLGSWDTDMHPERVFANTMIHAHGVTYAEKAKLPAMLYMYTGEPEYLRFALALQERIFSHHMLIDGVPSSTEAFRGTSSLGGHETCDISDHTWTWGYLLMATGDGIWADRIERACFNAGLGAIKKDWKAVQYFSCPNQMIATSDGTVNWGRHIQGCVAFRPNPGHAVACCGGNVHRFLPNYVIRMWMQDTSGGLAAILYGASVVSARVGAARQPVQIRQETNYPFDGNIHFAVDTSAPVRFPLSLRIPGWCNEPKLLLNGHDLPLPSVNKGFIRIERTFNAGDRLTLALPMHIKMSYWPDDGIGFERGPLVYSLPIHEKWTSDVQPTWSTAEFPEWEATPASEWNYALAVHEDQILSQTRVRQMTVAADPWLEPAVSIEIPVMKANDWQLTRDTDVADAQHSPTLPDLDLLEEQLSKHVISPDVDYVALVPYGATHLRVTIFPKIFVP